MNKESIGDRIKYLRKESGMSQEELAALLKTTKQAVYKYENNIVTNIPMDKIETLGKIFNVTPSYIMGWCGGIGDRIKMLRLDWNFTHSQLAALIKRSSEEIKAWEYGRAIPTPNDLDALSQVFDVTNDMLIADDQEILSALRSSPVKNKRLASFNRTENSRGVKIPVFGSVAAGIPIEAITDIEDYEEITEELARTGQFAALKIKGNSMEPRFTEGDVVIVHLQDTAENGDIAVVLINGDEATCKKIKRTPEGVMLISTNPAYEPMFFSNREINEKPVRIWGKVVELRAKF